MTNKNLSEYVVDDIRNTLAEWYDQTMDMDGPNLGVMAEKVYAMLAKEWDFMVTDTLSPVQMEIVNTCAIECKLQMSGEESVACMVNAWNWALGQCEKPPVVDDVLTLGRLVEPLKNVNGWRQVGVRVGWDIKGDWQNVPQQMVNLCELGVSSETPAEWFRQYEEVHPFVDGNGRSGLILFNWLNGTLDTPQWAPNFWDDQRRTEGHGA